MGEEQIINHKCPNCAAPLYYNIENTNWHCDFCGNSYQVKDVIEGAVGSNNQQEVVPQNWEQNKFEQSENVQTYLCSNCGGRVISDTNTIATFCAFCHSPAIIANKIKDDLKPDVVIPFKVTEEKAMIEFRKLLKLKPLLPQKFRECIKKGEITGLYVPFWLFSSDVNFHMSADGVQRVIWSKGNYQYTKTDTYFVKRVGTVPVENLPVDASQRIDNNIMDAIEPYDYRELTNFDTHYLMGMFAEAYDVHHSENYQRFYNRSKSTLEKLVRSSINHYTTTNIRNFDVSADTYGVKYGMFPVWLLSTKYKEKDYVFAINGQTGKSAGKLPISMQRMLIAFGSIGVAIGIILSILRLV